MNSILQYLELFSTMFLNKIKYNIAKIITLKLDEANQGKRNSPTENTRLRDLLIHTPGSLLKVLN